MSRSPARDAPHTRRPAARARPRPALAPPHTAPIPRARAAPAPPGRACPSRLHDTGRARRSAPGGATRGASSRGAGRGSVIGGTAYVLASAAGAGAMRGAGGSTHAGRDACVRARTRARRSHPDVPSRRRSMATAGGGAPSGTRADGTVRSSIGAWPRSRRDARSARNARRFRGSLPAAGPGCGRVGPGAAFAGAAAVADGAGVTSTSAVAARTVARAAMVRRALASRCARRQPARHGDGCGRGAAARRRGRTARWLCGTGCDGSGVSRMPRSRRSMRPAQRRALTARTRHCASARHRRTGCASAAPPRALGDAALDSWRRRCEAAHSRASPDAAGPRRLRALTRPGTCRSHGGRLRRRRRHGSERGRGRRGLRAPRLGARRSQGRLGAARRGRGAPVGASTSCRLATRLPGAGASPRRRRRTPPSRRPAVPLARCREPPRPARATPAHPRTLRSGVRIRRRRHALGRSRPQRAIRRAVAGARSPRARRSTSCVRTRRTSSARGPKSGAATAIAPTLTSASTAAAATTRPAGRHAAPAPPRRRRRRRRRRRTPAHDHGRFRRLDRHARGDDDAQRRRQPGDRRRRRHGHRRHVRVARERPAGRQRGGHVGVVDARRGELEETRVRMPERGFAVVHLAQREDQLLRGLHVRGRPAARLPGSLMTSSSGR